MNAASTRLPAPPVPPPPDGAWIGDMPLRDFAELDAVPASVAAARGHLARVLAEWGLGHLGEAAALVLSELMTNSVRATRAIAGAAPPPAVRLWLRGDTARVRLIVGDAVTDVPVPRAAGQDDESGRGLAIVAALAEDWGHYRPAPPFTGKVTWALVVDP
jgi:anti-sigma regulatory factor (Ser/Thr protein kinase)